MLPSLAEDRHGKWEELCFGVDCGWTAGQVLDNDASGSLNFKEFKAACRSLGEHGRVLVAAVGRLGLK